MNLKRKCFLADAELSKKLEDFNLAIKHSKRIDKMHLSDWYLQMLRLADFLPVKSNAGCFSSQSELINTCRILVLDTFRRRKIVLNKEIEIFIQSCSVALACYLLAYVNPAGPNLGQNNAQADLFVKKLDNFLTLKGLSSYRKLWQKNHLLEFKKTLLELNLILTQLSFSVLKKTKGDALNIQELHKLLKLNRRGIYLNSFEHHQFLLGLHYRYAGKSTKSNIQVSRLFTELKRSHSVVGFLDQISDL